MVLGLIMAGGASSRMRTNGATPHKALVPILGVPLIERNILTLLGAGIRDLVVSVNAHEAELIDYIHVRGRALASSRSARMECLEESTPLGTIGAAAGLGARADATLAVNVDNLTALDLKALLRHHLAADAALTVAVHRQSFRMPFGEVVVDDERAIEYREKPVQWTTVSSGTYVLAPRACALIPTRQSTDVPTLFRTLVDHGQPIAAFPHEALWVDVNDAVGVDDAERLVADHASQFELLSDRHERESLDLLAVFDTQALLQRRIQGDQWQALEVASSDGTCFEVDKLVDSLSRRLDVECCKLVQFDDLETVEGRVTRHHVVVARARSRDLAFGLNTASQWVDIDALDFRMVSPPLRRSIAWLRRLQ
jgi:NDP-mannose synthase